MTDYGSPGRLARAAAAVLLLGSSTLVLAACVTEQASMTPESSPATPMQDDLAAMPDVASLPPEAPPPDEILAQPLLPQAEPAPAAELPPPVPPPPQPLPADAQSLRAAYGTPAFIRREPDSELWRYDGKDCAAFFFLYLDAGTYRVRHSETNPRGQN